MGMILGAMSVDPARQKRRPHKLDAQTILSVMRLRCFRLCSNGILEKGSHFLKGVVRFLT